MTFESVKTKPASKLRFSFKSHTPLLDPINFAPLRPPQKILAPNPANTCPPPTGNQ